MMNGLPAVVTGVYDNAEALICYTELRGEFRHHINENMRGEFLIFRLKLRDALNMFFRDNQHVDGGFGRQILEGNDALIFVNELGRDLKKPPKI